MGMQSVGDKKNEKVIHNILKSFTNDSLVHPYIISVIQLYNGAIYPS